MWADEQPTPRQQVPAPHEGASVGAAKVRAVGGHNAVK